MRKSVRLVVTSLVVCLGYAGSLLAQDAALALSTSVGYNTQRLSLQLSDAQKAEAARLGEEATKATRAGKYGDALNDYAHGMAVMHGVDWNADAEYASALRAKLDHAMLAPGKATLIVSPLYATERAAQAKVSATVVLLQGGKEVGTLAARAAVDPAHTPFTEQVAIPADAAGDYALEVRLAEADGSSPEGLRTVFVKTVNIHVENLSGSVKRLGDALAKAGNNGGSSAIATARYTLELYDRADKGEVNPKNYDWDKEFTIAQGIADGVASGKDPFAGKHGDVRKAYLSKADQTLQPYRLYIPSGYDGSKPLPLVVALHGMGGDENSMFDGYGKELTVDCEKHGFIVVAPKGRGTASMYRGTAEQDVIDVIAEVERDYKVDKSRVYLMGHSMGGFGTWSIAIAHPDLFAALGPISGGGDASAMEKIKNIPEYVTHGNNDHTVNVNSSRSMVEAGKKIGVPITYVEVEGGSHTSVAQPALAPMMDFFEKQARPATMSSRE